MAHDFNELDTETSKTNNYNRFVFFVSTMNAKRTRALIRLTFCCCLCTVFVVPSFVFDICARSLEFNAILVFFNCMQSFLLVALALRRHQYVGGKRRKPIAMKSTVLQISSAASAKYRIVN